MRREVVPLTMESSMRTTRLPSTMLRTADSFSFTPISLRDWDGIMKVLPTYLLLISPISYGMPLTSL